MRRAIATAIIGMDITITEATIIIDSGLDLEEGEAFVVVHCVSTHSRRRSQRSWDIRTAARHGSSYD